MSILGFLVLIPWGWKFGGLIFTTYLPWKGRRRRKCVYSCLYLVYFVYLGAGTGYMV